LTGQFISPSETFVVFSSSIKTSPEEWIAAVVKLCQALAGLDFFFESLRAAISSTASAITGMRERDVFGVIHLSMTELGAQIE
jgi:hypothetical protein